MLGATAKFCYHPRQLFRPSGHRDEVDDESRYYRRHGAGSGLLRSQLSEPTTLQLGGCEFYQGKLAGKEVILTRSGIGKVAASVATSLLLEKFAPDCVINTGSAGGFPGSAHR
jgi:hypothetical protein